MKTLTPARCTEIAKKAAAVRWKEHVKEKK
jgi:hypothetical protein